MGGVVTKAYCAVEAAGSGYADPAAFLMGEGMCCMLPENYK